MPLENKTAKAANQEVLSMFKSKSFQYDTELKREIDIRGLSYLTFKNYRSQLRRISEHFSKDLKDVSLDEAKHYLHHLKNLKRHPQTINLCRAAYIFFRQSVIGDYVLPYALPRHKVIHKLPDILTSDCIVPVMESVSLKIRAILSLLWKRDAYL